MDALIYWWFVEPAIVITAAYLLISTTLQLGRKQVRIATKVSAALILGLAVWPLLPAWDTVYGRTFFEELCESDSGVKVFHKVALPASEIGEDGMPAFYNPQQIEAMFGGNYRLEVKREWIWVPRFSNARVRRDIVSLYERDSGKRLGQLVLVQFRPGGAPLLIAERRWLTCPDGASTGFGRLLGLGVFEARPDEKESTK
jgi:hypothetical protein